METEIIEEQKEPIVIEGFEDITDEKVLKIIQDAKNGSVEEESEEEPNDEPKMYAGVYKTLDALKKGITDIGSTLPKYMIDGMSEDALEQYYIELRKDMSKNGKKKTEDKKEEKKDNNEKVDPKVYIQELNQFFKDEGYVSDEIYDKLEEAGIPSDIIDGYVEKLEIEQTQFGEKVINLAGGTEQFFIIKEWAENNISQQELDAIGKLPYNTMLLAMEGIKNRYEKANGKTEPKANTRIVGKTGSVSSGGYESREDYFRDVKNSKYGRDKHFTDSVEKRFSQSRFK